MGWVRALFVSPSDAWWYVPAATTVVLATLIAWGVAHWPRRFAAPLAPGERRAAKRPRPARLLMSAVVPTAIAVGAFGLVTLAYTPRRPCALVLTARDLPDDPAAWDHLPPAFERVDAGPVVDRVLAAADEKGAAKWVTDSPAARDSLRELCLEELRRYAAGGGFPTARPKQKLPAWVTGSAEMTVYAALARCLENPAVERVRAVVGRPGEGWDRAAPLVVRAGHPSPLVAVPEPPRPRVRYLFDGKALDGNKRVQLQVAVETPAGQPATSVTIVVADPATVDPAKPDSGTREEITVAVPADGWAVVPIDRAVKAFAPAAALVATAEGGAVRTPLPAVAGPGQGADFAATVAAADQKLIDLWAAVLGPDPPPGGPPQTPLRVNCLARGWRVPRLTTDSAAGRPTIHVTADEILVTAAGLSPADIPVAVRTAAFDPVDPTLPPQTVPVFGDRVSRVGGPASLDSWMSLGVSLPPGAVPAPAAERVASGFRLNARIEDGRRIRSRAAERAVAEYGQVDKPGQVGKLGFARVRLNPDREALWLGAEGFSPAKSRAFVASLVWACNAVVAAAPPAAVFDRRADDPEAAPLLTRANEQELLDLGRRPADGRAVAALGVYLFTITAAAWVLGRQPRPETSP